MKLTTVGLMPMNFIPSNRILNLLSLKKLSPFWIYSISGKKRPIPIPSKNALDKMIQKSKANLLLYAHNCSRKSQRFFIAFLSTEHTECTEYCYFLFSVFSVSSVFSVVFFNVFLIQWLINKFASYDISYISDHFREVPLESQKNPFIFNDLWNFRDVVFAYISASPI